MVRASVPNLGGRWFKHQKSHNKDFKNGTYCVLVRRLAIRRLRAQTISIDLHPWGGGNSSLVNAIVVVSPVARVPQEVTALPLSSVAVFVSSNSSVLCLMHSLVCPCVWDVCGSSAMSLRSCDREVSNSQPNLQSTKLWSYLPSCMCVRHGQLIPDI